ncbi:MAG: MutS family DNA mismatch repair protein [bacterium]
MKKAREEYEKRYKKYNKAREKLSKELNTISNLRLLTILIGVALPINLFIINNQSLGILFIIISTIVFLLLIMKHQKTKNIMRYYQKLCTINDNSLKRFTDDWKSFKDKGDDFVDEKHNFSFDLDLFGKASLFQWINTSNTFLGRIKLKNTLINNNNNKDNIIVRQEAIKELATKIDWRQSFQAIGMDFEGKIKNPDKLIAWSKENSFITKKKALQFNITILPILTIIFIASSIYLQLPIYFFVTTFILQLIMLGMYYKDLSLILAEIGKYTDDINLYGKLIEKIEQEPFKSSYLRALKEELKQNHSKPACVQLKSLESVLGMMSLRYMPLYILFDILFLWDFRCALSFEKWKRKYGSHLKIWLDIVGEFESLSSLAILSFDNPDWTTPKINESKRHVISTSIGHPLLLEATRVNNSFTINKSNNIVLITGSNMSGKSTFLRTVGINLVLAYTGSTVCAKIFECGLFDIYTSMRIKDNLEENTSSFYAELLRIKKIIDATKNDNNVFFLLDEIFKGTNSRDRHTGAKTLIYNLSKKNTLGLISTHDLELGELEQKEGYNVKNYHFEEQYKDNKIYFDYKLRNGLSTSFNAIYLMKQIGIDFVAE